MLLTGIPRFRTKALLTSFLLSPQPNDGAGSYFCSENMKNFSPLRKPKEGKPQPSVLETPKSKPTRSMTSWEQPKSKPVRSMSKLTDVLKRNGSSATLEKIQNDSTPTLASSTGSKSHRFAAAKQIFTRDPSRRPSMKTKRSSSPGSSSDDVTLASDGRPSFQGKRDSKDSVSYSKRVSLTESFHFVRATDVPVASSPIEVTADIQTATVDLSNPSEAVHLSDPGVVPVPVLSKEHAEVVGTQEDGNIQATPLADQTATSSDYQLPPIPPSSPSFSLPQLNISVSENPAPVAAPSVPVLVTSMSSALDVPERIPQPLSPIMESVAATPVVENAGSFARDAASQPRDIKDSVSTINQNLPTDLAASAPSSTLVSSSNQHPPRRSETTQPGTLEVSQDELVGTSVTEVRSTVHVGNEDKSLPPVAHPSVLSGEARHSVHPGLVADTPRVPPTRDDRHLPNVLFFGDTGVGKSSVISMLAGSDIVPVSNAADGMTMSGQSYVANIDGVRLSLWDTPGLNEIEGGTTHARVAMRNIRDLIGVMQEGLSLLVYCMRAGRFRPHHKANYDLIVDTICQAKVPAIIVITGLENQVPRSSWWTQNAGEFYDHGMKFDGYVCVTATRGKPSRVRGFLYDKEYKESQEDLKKLIKDFFATPRSAWTIEDNEAWAKKTSLKMDDYFEGKKDGTKHGTSDLTFKPRGVPRMQVTEPPKQAGMSQGQMTVSAQFSPEQSKSWSEWLGGFWYGSNSCA